MTARIEREKTTRARAMALPAPQQAMLLAYLSGTVPDKVESGLEFLASLGIADQAQAAPPASPGDDEPAPADGEALVPCGDVRPHWPHARCPGMPVAPAEAATGPVPCRRTNAHRPHGLCHGTAPEFPSEPIETVPEPARHLAPVPALGAAMACTACDWHGPAAGAPNLTCPRCFGAEDVVPYHAAMHPGGYASAVPQ